MKILKTLKDFALLIGMIVGAFLSEWIYVLAPYLPLTLFVMLLLSYTKVHPYDLRPKRSHYILFVIQWGLGLLAYFLIRPKSEILAQGAALMILTPTATAAPVITNMLGGNVAYVTTYMLPSNILIALVAPVMISTLYPEMSSSYVATFLDILSQASSIIILPLAIVWFLRFALPRVHDRLGRYSWLTFYVWVVAITVISANTVHLFRHDDSLTMASAIESGVISLVCCLLLYSIGHLVALWMGGASSNCRQTLGQKNTILAIWLASSFMDPYLAIIPTFYTIWQNTINSLEIAAYNRRIQ
ncbi:MAG: hypothetical protein Q4D93_05960 [Porphyromonas sp.]|nr:hypothetical protein [Porphyromonas sp.]